MKKKPAFVLGVTPNMAFAAGTLLLGLQRHLLIPEYDVLIIHQNLSGSDAEILSGFYNCRLLTYDPLFLDKSALPPNYPLYFLYRFEMFRLLEQYKTLVWLDCDIAVQGDLSRLLEFGPMAMATQDTVALQPGVKYTLGRNFLNPVPGYNMDADFANSGVLVLQDTLPAPLELYSWCMHTFAEQRANLRHTDQGVLNLLALTFPDIFQNFSANVYNCYPLNSSSIEAKIVHCFGAKKFWNDGLLNIAFPEWRRDYALWKSLGGSAYAGPVADPDFTRRGTYQILLSLVEKLNVCLDNKEQA
ncbi:MAG: hypothetical protein LBM00_05695 [Deltaproteobacteria bacterium]|jgi:hypothetical protein|nr:hypothetical protein [Deltaproteobacteria bacterium]